MLAPDEYIRGEVTIKSDAMNPYQVMGIIACCTIVFAGVVTLLTMQGVHILYAFLGVYLLAIWWMLSMQRRARESFEFREDLKLRQSEQETRIHRRRASDFPGANQSETQTIDHLQV